MTDPVGFIALTVSICFFGSYAVMIKSEKVVKLNVDAMVFQCYYSASAAVILLIVAAIVTSGQDFGEKNIWLSVWGIIGAAMWIVSQVLGYLAIRVSGLAVSLATWAGVTVVVGFLIGVAGFGQELSSISGCVFGLLILCVGIVGAAVLPGKLMRANELLKAKNASTADENGFTEESELLLSSNGKEWYGLCLAVAMGLVNGAIMVPMTMYSKEMELAPTDPKSASYLASFSVGILITTPPLAFLWFAFCVRRIPPVHLNIVAIPGLITGMIWSVGYIGATYSTILLGLAIGYPMTQAAILIAGLWGVFYFKEIQGNLPILAFFASGGTILVGVVLMSYFGQPPIEKLP